MEQVNCTVLEHDFPLQTVKQLTCLTDLQQCMVEKYRQTHQRVSPLNENILMEDFFHAMLENSYLQWSFYSVLESGIAYFISEKTHATTCFITYIGGSAHSHQLLQFYKHCLSKLKQQGVTSLDYEIDDCNMKQMLFISFIRFVI